MLAPHTSCVLLAILASGSAMSATSVVSPAILRVWVEEAAPLLANCLDDQNHLQPLLSSSTEKEEALRQTAPPFVLGRAPLESWRSFRSSSSSTCASLMTNASRPHTPVAALLGNLQRCASPWYRIREIQPHHVSWSPDKSKDAAADDPATDSDAADHTNSSNHEGTTGLEGGKGEGAKETSSRPAPEANTSSAKPKAPSKTEAKKPPEYLGFLLVTPGDGGFSAELEATTRAVAPAFPRITFVKGNGAAFRLFCAQYRVTSFPKLLVFKDGLLAGKFKAPRRQPADLTAFLANVTNTLPQALVSPFAYRLPPDLWDPEPDIVEPSRASTTAGAEKLAGASGASGASGEGAAKLRGAEPSAAFVNAGDFPGSAGLAGGGLTGGRWATPSSQHAHTTTGITTTGGNTTGAANRAEPNEDSEPLNSSTGENASPSITEESRKAESTDDEKEGTGSILHESSAGSKSLESVLRSLTLPVTQSVEVWAQSLSTAVQRATGNSVGGTAGFGYVFGSYGFGRVGFGGFGEAYIYGDLHHHHHHHPHGSWSQSGLFSSSPSENSLAGFAGSCSSSSSGFAGSAGSGGSSGGSNSGDGKDLPLSEIVKAQAWEFVAWVAGVVSSQRDQWMQLSRRFVGLVGRLDLLTLLSLAFVGGRTAFQIARTFMSCIQRTRQQPDRTSFSFLAYLCTSLLCASVVFFCLGIFSSWD